MTVTVANVWGGSVSNVAPGADRLVAGSATFFVQTAPRPVREILPGKQRDSSSGKAASTATVCSTCPCEVTGRALRRHTGSTGIVNCNRVAVGNPDPGEPPTATPQPDDPTPTAPPIDTPEPTATRSMRPTRTPIPPRPTRTPRVDPTDTPTRVPTNTATRTDGCGRRARRSQPPRRRARRIECSPTRYADGAADAHSRDAAGDGDCELPPTRRRACR